MPGFTCGWRLGPLSGLWPHYETWNMDDRTVFLTHGVYIVTIEQTALISASVLFNSSKLL